MVHDCGNTFEYDISCSIENPPVPFSFNLPNGEAMLRVEVETLPTGTTSRVREVRFPGELEWETSQPQHAVWPSYLSGYPFASA